VHGLAAGVLADLLDRGRDHLVDPVLHAEGAVGEGDLAVLHEVGGPAAGDQVLDQRAAAAQVEAERGRGERRDQEDRVALLLHPLARTVVVDLPQHPVVDQGPGHRSEIGQPAVQHLVRDIAGC
jgi:hypothetical protein